MPWILFHDTSLVDLPVDSLFRIFDALGDHEPPHIPDHVQRIIDEENAKLPPGKQKFLLRSYHDVPIVPVR